MKLSPCRRERQWSQDFAPELAGLWLQKAFGESPSSSYPLPVHQPPATGLWHPTKGQQWAVDVEGAAHSQCWSLNLPILNASLVQSSHPTWDMLHGKEMPERCSLEGQSPPARSISQPGRARKPCYMPELFPGRGRTAKASCEFKATGSSVLVRNTEETSTAKIRDLGRGPVVHARICTWSCRQQLPAPSTLLCCLPITDHRAGAARSRKEPCIGPWSLRAPTIKALCKESHPYIS